jgi:hypothetical protein
MEADGLAPHTAPPKQTIERVAFLLDYISQTHKLPLKSGLLARQELSGPAHKPVRFVRFVDLGCFSSSVTAVGSFIGVKLGRKRHRRKRANPSPLFTNWRVIEMRLLLLGLLQQKTSKAGSVEDCERTFC